VTCLAIATHNYGQLYYCIVGCLLIFIGMFQLAFRRLWATYIHEKWDADAIRAIATQTIITSFTVGCTILYYRYVPVTIWSIGPAIILVAKCYSVYKSYDAMVCYWKHRR